MKNKDFNKFIIRAMFFILPIIALYCVELFILPIDFFNFRVWESVIVRNFKPVLSGPFYPNQHIVKVEEGDLVPHTPFAVKKRAQWQTDKFGYRKNNTNDKKQEIIIIGDSFTVGCGLSQKEILSEVLESKIKKTVYPLATADINTFLNEKRFMINPPDIIVVAAVEREILSLPPPKKQEGVKAKINERLKDSIQKSSVLQSSVVLLDRIIKANMFNYFKSKISRLKPAFIRYPGSSMFFLQGDIANAEVSEEEIKRAAKVIEEYRNVLNSKGIRFIFMSIPNKENIYYQILPSKKKALFLTRLMKELKSRNIEVIDVQSEFEKINNKGVLLYIPDDSHWNAVGVKTAARLLINEINKNEFNK